MKKSLRTLALSLAFISVLPLAGLLISGRSLKPYLEFPPTTRYIAPAPFSWPAFILYALLISVLIAPFLFQFLDTSRIPLGRPFSMAKKMPWWGYLGIFFGLLAWVIAWNRFPGLKPYQAHTFTPLWLAYILVINALTYQRTLHCLMLDQPVYYGLLFPLSAVLWWLFEFLNRFVQNWYYVGASFGPLEYFWYATLPFATVLPAVIGTREWLLSFSWPEKYFKTFLPMRIHCLKLPAWLALIMAGSGLCLLGLFPHYLFSLLWVSPLIIIIALQAIFNERLIFSNITRGDWTLIVVSAAAALICGFFWEMWNFFSLAKWKYQIPFVQRFSLFEMPLLGYAGYLPFGLECSVIADLVLKSSPRGKIKRSFLDFSKF
jgi:hypothetical protein